MGSDLLPPRRRRSIGGCVASASPLAAFVVLSLTAVIGLVGALVAPAPRAAAAADSPSGFYFGTDSYGPHGRGAGAPYREPGTGGLFAGYVGELGTWTNWLGCTRGYGLNHADVSRVNADEAYGPIPGVFFYWFAAGPGADPSFDGSRAEAYRWGVRQAERARADYTSLTAHGITTATSYIPLLFMDIEGQPLPGYGNGWNEVVDRCGHITHQRVIAAAVDRSTFNGFTDYLHTATIFHPGVYSTPSYWNQTFGAGAPARVPNTYQWTPVTSTGAVLPRPVAFSQGPQRATWFGDVRLDRRAGWQWNQSGGDYDQWSTANLP